MHQGHGHAPGGAPEPPDHGAVADGRDRATPVVLHVGGMYLASEKSVVETALSRRPGVLDVEANPVSQTATVTFDPAVTSVAQLRTWVEECGMHCAGQSVPTHVCDPMEEPAPGTRSTRCTAARQSP